MRIFFLDMIWRCCEDYTDCTKRVCLLLLLVILLMMLEMQCHRLRIRLQSLSRINLCQNILIYGAGAIGRGYVPWLFKDEEVDLSFVESNQELRNNLLDQGSYTSFMTNDKGYDSLKVDFKDCLTEHDVNFSIYDGVITAVGPRQIFELRDSLSKFDCPVLFFENDSSLPDQLASLTGSSNFYFGIPDVITSNTAPDKLLDHDPLSITTESGISFADQSAFQIGGDIQYVETKELWKQWMAKLYMHNTPHCIAAYLGSLYNQDYLHEGMSNNSISKIVEGSMIEMGQTISKYMGLMRILLSGMEIKNYKDFQINFYLILSQELLENPSGNLV